MTYCNITVMLNGDIKDPQVSMIACTFANMFTLLDMAGK